MFSHPPDIVRSDGDEGRRKATSVDDEQVARMGIWLKIKKFNSAVYLYERTST